MIELIFRFSVSHHVTTAAIHIVRWMPYALYGSRDTAYTTAVITSS